MHGRSLRSSRRRGVQMPCRRAAVCSPSCEQDFFCLASNQHALTLTSAALSTKKEKARASPPPLVTDSMNVILSSLTGGAKRSRVHAPLDARACSRACYVYGALALRDVVSAGSAILLWPVSVHVYVCVWICVCVCVMYVELEAPRQHSTHKTCAIYAAHSVARRCLNP